MQCQILCDPGAYGTAGVTALSASAGSFTLGRYFESYFHSMGKGFRMTEDTAGGGINAAEAGRWDAGPGRRTRPGAHTVRDGGVCHGVGGGVVGHEQRERGGGAVGAGQADAAARVRRPCGTASGAARPTRHRGGEISRRLPQAPVVRGRRPARRAGRNSGAAPADRQGGALCGVRREDRHRRGVPGRPADRHGRGHRLRPGVGVETVHVDPGRAADRTRQAGAGGARRLLPPRIHAAAASRTSPSVSCSRTPRVSAPGSPSTRRPPARESWS